MNLNLSTNRRKIGAIGLIAAGLIAVAVPFLLHGPLNANTANGNGSGGNGGTNTNTNSNTNPTTTTTPTSTNPGGSGSDSNSGGSGSSAGACDHDEKDKNDTAGDPGHGHKQGHAYAYGHSKDDDRDKDPLHAIMNRLSKLGSDSPSFHHHNSTRTDNGLGQENSQGNSHSASNHGHTCEVDNEDQDETD